MVSKCNRIASLITHLKLQEGGGGCQPPLVLLPLVPSPLGEPNGVQWPYHFLKADDGPVSQEIPDLFSYHKYSNMQLYIRRCFIICMCKILVKNFIIKDILKKKNDVHRISVRTIDSLILSYIRIDKDKRVFSYCCKLKQYNRTCVDATLHSKCFNDSLLQ